MTHTASRRWVFPSLPQLTVRRMDMAKDSAYLETCAILHGAHANTPLSSS